MNAVTAGERGTTAGVGEYLTFRLGGEEYGIDVLKVQEIRGYELPTRVAGAPAFIKGVSNLRGTIVPIIDMRIRLRCESVEYDHQTVVIVLRLHDRVVGMVVDAVSDVVELAESRIWPAPDVEGMIDARSIRGLGVVGERMLILLDIERLMAADDMGLVADTA